MTVATREMDAQTRETAERWASVLRQGKSREIGRFLSKPSEADGLGIFAGLTVLTDGIDRDNDARAVAVFSLRKAGKASGVTSEMIADAMGRSKSRVTQLAKVGEVIATLGLPQGWKVPVSGGDLDKLASGGYSKALGEILALKVSVDDKRKLIGRLADKRTGEIEAAQADAKAKADQAKAERKALKDAKLGTEPTEQAESPTETPAWEQSDKATAEAFRSIVEGCGYLSTFPGALNDTQRATVLAALGTLVDALSA